MNDQIGQGGFNTGISIEQVNFDTKLADVQ
jgi:hypothetical protein